MTSIENYRPVDGNIEALHGVGKKEIEKTEELNTGSLFANLKQEDLKLIDSALNLIGFERELNDFVTNFEFDGSNESKKKEISILSEDVYHAVSVEDKKKKAKELARLISQLYN